jgi:hypothetical protein
MNRSVAAAFITLIVLTVGATPTLAASTDHVVAVGASSAAPCTPSTSKIGGDPATTFCGPATATLTVGGKTYKFKGGYCKEFNGSFTDLTLGTLVGVNGTPNTIDNKKKPYFRMDLGTGNSSDLQLPYYGGNLLGAEGPFKWKGGISTKGTYKSLGATPEKYSGTYNCNGVFVGG